MPMHHTDDDCTVLNGECIVCHVTHGDPCVSCGGRGFHADDCADNETEIETSLADADEARDDAFLADLLNKRKDV